MDFATLESRSNAVIFAKLANMTATIAGVANIRAIFDQQYVEPMGFAGSAPVLKCLSADVSTVVQGSAVVLGVVNYTVAAIKPDGNGLTLLQLAEV
jgi:hypothetical protein